MKIKIYATSDVHGTLTPYRYSDHKEMKMGMMKLSPFMKKDEHEEFVNMLLESDAQLKEYVDSIELGKDGLSAYMLAKKYGGFEGTLPEWLESLKGEKGDQGEMGPQGPQGEMGPQGPAGESCNCVTDLQLLLDEVAALRREIRDLT